MTQPPNRALYLQPGTNWTRHKNGGGWISASATVSPMAYIGPGAVVCGDAIVTRTAYLHDDAAVLGGTVDGTVGLASVVFPGARVEYGETIRGVIAAPEARHALPRDLDRQST